MSLNSLLMSATLTTKALSRSVSQRVKPLLSPSSPSPTATPPRAEDPTDPAPQDGPAPSDCLLNRLGEIGTIIKSLQGYFEGVAQSHIASARALDGAAAVQAHFTDASLFLPGVASEDRPQDIGWASLLSHLKADGPSEAAKHVNLARTLSTNVIPVLANLRDETKGQIVHLGEEVNPLLTAVRRLRTTYTISLAQLTKALTLSSGESSPSSVDPVLVRASVEQHAIAKVTKENELILATLKWQGQVKEFEIGVFGLAKKCLKDYEEARTSHLKDILQSCAATGKHATLIAPDAEWKYFETLHHLLPTSIVPADLTKLDYPGRDAAETQPLKQGSLERKKRFVPNWKKAFFLLSPSGYLYEYTSPSAPLDKPHIAFFLPNCQIGPIEKHELIQGETSSVPRSPGAEKIKSASEAIKAAAELRDAPVEVPAYKFLLEGRRVVSGTIGIGHSELARFLRASSREEIQEWWDAISKFTKIPGTNTNHSPIKLFKRSASATVVEPQHPAEALEGDGAASDDEAFDEARTQPVETPDVTTTPALKAPADKGLLSKARSMKIPRLSKKPSTSDLAKPKAAAAAPEDGGEAKPQTPTTSDVAAPSADSDAAAVEAPAPTMLGRLLGSSK